MKEVGRTEWEDRPQDDVYIKKEEERQRQRKKEGGKSQDDRDKK
jgi:hypothetical protein